MLKSRDFSFKVEDFQELYQNPEFQKEGISFPLPESSQAWLKELKLSPLDSDSLYPYFFSCSAQTLDGKLTLAGEKKGSAVARSMPENPIGGELDFWWFNLARATADALMVGAETLRCEPYLRSHLWDLDLRAGYPSPFGMPVHIIPTRTGDLGADPEVLKNPEIPLILYTTKSGFLALSQALKRPFALLSQEETVSLERLSREVCILLIEDFEDDLAFFAWLKKQGMNRILVESSSLPYQLLELKLLKEMWITTVGVFSGEASGSREGFKGSQLPQARLISLYQSGGSYLYARYRLF